MGYLSVQHLRKNFGDFRAVDDIGFDIARGEICTLLGPSGCGKTTTLRCIAGLEQADSGTITLDGRVLYDSASGTAVAPETRDLGMVFQSYALWPHKSVFDNVALGLRIKGVPRGEIRDRVEEGLALVGMAGAGKRYPASLSGGQQQRVALARALTLRPKCILFDEPLSNLDLLLRERMRFEIRELLVKVGITAVYVTHDQSEAMVISDHIIVLNGGRIEREGPPAEVYARPRNAFTAQFLGRTNLVPVNIAASDPGNAVIAGANGARFVSRDSQRFDPARKELFLAFRPEAVHLGDGAPAANRFKSKVVSSQFLGSSTEVLLDFQGVRVNALLLGNQPQKPGEEVEISIDPADVLVLTDSDAAARRPAG
jgi:ABC-type Fe3+/spermidine/putrescine transport system ATPase subunit